jgi:hypothetical protein
MNRITENYLPKLVAAIEVLDQETLWKHEVQWMNSIGGIVLHLCEHVKRHIIRYSRTGNVTGGIEDYFPDLGISSEELILQVKDLFGQWKSVMNLYLAGQHDLEFLDMNDIYHLVEHPGYHLGQIIDRTQRLTHTSFQFVQNGINEKRLKEYLNMGD